MKKKISFISLALAVCIFCFYVYCQDTKTVKIIAADGWHNSGIYLQSGEIYSVRASGRWVSGYGHSDYGPEGWGYGTITNDALVGWIGDERPAKLGYGSYEKSIIQRIILIGEGGTFKAYGNGYLFLAMGEWSGCRECRGEVTARISKR